MVIESLCNCYTAQAMLPALFCMIATYLFNLYRSITHIDDTKLDKKLQNLLEGKSPEPVCKGDVCLPPKPCITAIDPKCAAIVKALNSAALTENEEDCAKQMSNIVSSKALPYSAMMEVQI